VSGLKHVREYQQVARREGAKCVATLHLGKHLRLVFEAECGRFELTIPASPSDHRGRIKFRADVRRRMKAAA
jgi:hypothetical protein